MTVYERSVYEKMLQKVKFLIVCLGVILFFTGCAPIQTDNVGLDASGERYIFEACVVRVTEGQILVMPSEGGIEADVAGSEGVWVSMRLLDGSSMNGLSVGDTIVVTYNGMIAYSYPAQILGVYSIVKTARETQGD